MNYIDFTLEETESGGDSFITVTITRIRMDGIFKFHVWYKVYDDVNWTLFDSAFGLSYAIPVTTQGTRQVRVQTEALAPRVLESFDLAPMKSIQVTLTSNNTYTGTFQTHDPATTNYAILDNDDDTVKTYRSSVKLTELSDMAYTDSVKALTSSGLSLVEDGGTLGVFVEDSTGHVGIGHNAPETHLHLKATSDSFDRNELVSNDAVAPEYQFVKRRGASTAGQDGDDIGGVLFKSHNDDSPVTLIDYAKILSEIVDASAGTEEGSVTVQVMDAGSLTSVTKITSDGLEILSGDIAMQASATVDGVDVSAHEANTTTLHPDPDGQTNKYLKSDGSVYTWSSSTVAAHDVDGVDHNAPTPVSSESFVLTAINDLGGGTVITWSEINTGFNLVVGTTAGTVAAGNHDHALVYAPIAKGVTNGDTHNHYGGDGGIIDVMSQQANSGTVGEFLTLTGGASPPYTLVSSGYTAATFAVAAKGVTNGDSHNHYGGDGGIIDVMLQQANSGTKGEFLTLTGGASPPYTLASSGYDNTDFAPAAKGVTNGDSHDHNGGDGAQIAYSTLSGIPSTFAPSAHASSHHSGGADAMDLLSMKASSGTGGDFVALGAGASPPFSVVSSGYSSSDFAAASHAHSGSDITSGTISNDRMPSAISISGNITSTAGNISAGGYVNSVSSYRANGTSGTSGSFGTSGAYSITVVGGIITAITPE